MIYKNKEKFTLGIVIDTDFRIPPITGVTYRLYFLSKKLAELGINVKIFICNRNIKNRNDEKVFYEKSYLEYHIIPESVFYNPCQLLTIIRNNKLDIIQFEDSVSVLRYQNIFQKLKLPVCLEMHDIEASLKEMLNYSNQDIKLTIQTSKAACSLVEKVICMTPLDYSELVGKLKIKSEKLAIVPNPIDLDQFTYFGPNIKSKNILFMGNMFYWPNQNAALKIIEQIVPEVKKVIKKVRFTFVGLAPHSLKHLSKDGVLFTGNIKDINAIFKKTTLALCPVFEGSGMKVKILNYCAAGLPVITTSIGSSGYEQVKSLIIENDIHRYPGLIIKSLREGERLQKIGEQNRSYIEEYFDLTVIAQKMQTIYQDMIQNRQKSKKKKYPLGNFSAALVKRGTSSENKKSKLLHY